jgi:hypoxanthine phosphoribosyltransferase
VTAASAAAPGDVVLAPSMIAAHVRRLATEIEADHPQGVVLVGVLKGSLLFLADLARAVQRVLIEIDFLAISRYAPDSGRVRIVKDLDLDVTGRDVVIVDDLVDTGLTIAYLLQHVQGRGARRVEVCTLLDRAQRRIVPLPLRYVGLEVAGDEFLLGYGLRVGERYRNLPAVVRGDRSLLDAEPDAYLGLYGMERRGSVAEGPR